MENTQYSLLVVFEIGKLNLNEIVGKVNKVRTLHCHTKNVFI